MKCGFLQQGAGSSHGCPLFTLPSRLHSPACTLSILSITRKQSSHRCILLLVFLLLLGQETVLLTIERQEGNPGTVLVFCRGGPLVGAAIQLLDGAAFSVQLAVHLLAASLLGVSVKDAAGFQHRIDVADRHR